LVPEQADPSKKLCGQGFVDGEESVSVGYDATMTLRYEGFEAESMFFLRKGDQD
jgi:hypothetical protein